MSIQFKIKTGIFIFILSLYSCFLAAQNSTINGRISDQAGAPLADVSVSVKGSNNGTVSKEDDSYSLSLPASTDIVLIFSKVGYIAKEGSSTANGILDISLDAAENSLNAVVVVGYGKQSKRKVTGSVASVSLKGQESLPTTNILQAVRGRVAGVQFIDNGRPGQGGDILIRGERSITAGNSPLIILDGVFFNGNLADINPGDIASMDILKDASSAAIYGSRAANGVILITTKAGKDSKPTVRFNTYYAINNRSYKMKLLSPERYLQKTLDYRAQNGLAADPANIESYLTPSEAQNYRDGMITDPWDVVSQNSGTTSYDLSVSGKDEKTSYFLSGSFANEKGLIYNDNSKRISLRANLENKVRKWLTIGITSQFSQRDLSGLEADLSSAYRTSPFSTLYFADGAPQRYTMPEDQLTANPLYNALLNTNEEKYYNLFANLYGIVDLPLKGLTYRLNYSPGYRWQRNYNYTRQDPHLTVNNTLASKFNQTNFDWTMENILTYNKVINADNAFDITLLYGLNHAEFENTTATGTTLPSDVTSWNNLVQAATQTIGSAALSQDGVSSMARINYQFKNRYFLTLTGRRDGSSVFSKNNKYAFFPSAALAWVVSDETFMDKIPTIDLLKLRLSYGGVGNQAINPYQSLSLTTTSQYVYGDGSTTSTGIYALNMANPNLKWETTYSTNLALDFSVLGGRIGGTVEYYSMQTKDLLLSRTIPVTNGFSTFLANLGETKNTGVEVTLNAIPIKLKDFEWNATVAFSYNNNKIVHIYNSDVNGDGKEDDDVANAWFVGQPINVAFDYLQDGIYQKGDVLPTGYKEGWVKMKDVDGNGVINTSDRTVQGTLRPKYRWSVSNEFRYKRFSLSVFVNALEGWIAPLNLLSTAAGSAIGAKYPNPNYPGRPANMLDAGWWTEASPSADRPSLNYTNPLGHNFYKSRDFVRLQDVSLTYDVPKEWLKKAGIGSLRLYVSGRNLYTWTKWPGPDPESGADYFPIPRSLAFGLNLSF